MVGNSAPERKSSGIMRKFMIRLNPCISFSLEAMASPSPMKAMEIRIMKASAIITPAADIGLKPITKEIISIAEP